MQYKINPDQEAMKEWIENGHDFETYAEDNVLVMDNGQWVSWGDGDYPLLPIQQAENYKEVMSVYEDLEPLVIFEIEEWQEQRLEDYFDYYRNIGLA